MLRHGRHFAVRAGALHFNSFPGKDYQTSSSTAPVPTKEKRFNPIEFLTQRTPPYQYHSPLAQLMSVAGFSAPCKVSILYRVFPGSYMKSQLLSHSILSLDRHFISHLWQFDDVPYFWSASSYKQSLVPDKKLRRTSFTHVLLMRLEQSIIGSCSKTTPLLVFPMIVGCDTRATRKPIAYHGQGLALNATLHQGSS
jgi:hypothetical protein